MQDISPSPFDIALRADLPPAAARWAGYPTFNFVGGHNAPEGIPLEELSAAMTRVLEREGRDLALYTLQSGPLGYRPLREFVASQVKRSAGMTVDPDEILLVSGSLQGMELINAALLAPGDAVIIEADNYGGVFSRLRRIGAEIVPVAVDDDGMDVEDLERQLQTLAGRGIVPKYIYSIPTVQNPTGTVLSEARRRRLIELAAEYDVPVFEDDCYADLTFDGTRPPALHALDDEGRVVYLGTFSKSIAPALRVGYVIAPWAFLSRLVALKTDAGSGALEQMLLGEYCPDHFEAHVSRMRTLLKSKLETLQSALAEHFGTAADPADPKGGIFLWVKLPDSVDTTRLAAIAGAEGIAINPGVEWSVAPHANRAIRICFATPSHDDLRSGVARLAEICHAEFGVPARSANQQRD